jgi:hypothetical protein
MKEQQHANEIIAWAHGSEIEYYSQRTNVWCFVRMRPSWRPQDTYRVAPGCEYALSMVPDVELYKEWLDGALITQIVFGDFNHLSFIDACDTEDPFGTWMNEHNGTMTRTKKMVKQTRWINVSVISTATQDTIDGFCVTKRPLPYGTLEAHWAWITDGETPPTDWHQISADKREIEQ